MPGKEKTYSLSTIAIPDVIAVRPLSIEEFSKYVEHISIITKQSFDESLFRIVELNYEDVKSIFSYYSIIDNQEDYFKENHLLLKVNRLIFNFLSSIRMYLDHTETKLKREFGVNSEVLAYFTQQTNNAYDKCFAYRFLYKLRNYAQHCGLPPLSYTTHSEAIGNIETETNFKLFLDRDTLISKYDSWGKPVGNELKNMDDKFEIIPLLDDKFLRLKDLNKNINSRIYSNLHVICFELLDLVVETLKTGGRPCLIESKLIGKELKLTLHHFPFEAITKYTGVNFKDSQQDI